MLLKVDYNFNYRYLFRFLLIQKSCFLGNTFEIPVLSKLLVFFSLNELENFDDPRVFNYFYLFRFFFGRKCFFKSFKSFYGYNKSFYNFNLQIFFKKRTCFFPLFFLVNDLLFLSSRRYFYNFFVLSKYIFILRFFDLNLISEKKTNLGLFHLYDNLNFKFFFECSNIDYCNIFLNFFKIF